MTDHVSRLLLLIASTNLTNTELRNFGRWLEKNGAHRMVLMVERLREFARDGETSNSPSSRWVQYGDEEGRGSDPTLRIERLLTGEAGLTKSKAATLLKSELEERHGVIGIPDMGRTAFRAWLYQVAEMVPESVLFHVATKLRNEYVHGVRPDWPLKQSRE